MGGPVVLFRVDAGLQVGLGHLRRCLGLAAALQGVGATCVFLVNRDPAVQRRVAAFHAVPFSINGAALGGTQDLQRTLDAAVRYQCSAVVVDSYHVDADFLGRLRAARLVVVAISDAAGFPFPCQFVVNGGAHASQLPYRALSDDTRFLLGPQYAMLGSEFWTVPPRHLRPTVERVLVTLGGADSHRLLPRLLALLDGLPGEFTVTVIVGPFVDGRAELECVASNRRRAVDLVYDPTSLRDLMLHADLAISAGGQTLYELAVTGTPAVAVQTAENQTDNLRAMAAQGSVRGVGQAHEAHVLSTLDAALRAILGDHGGRVAMSIAGQQLVDGRGAQRVAGAVIGSHLPARACE